MFITILLKCLSIELKLLWHIVFYIELVLNICFYCVIDKCIESFYMHSYTTVFTITPILIYYIYV